MFDFVEIAAVENETARRRTLDIYPIFLVKANSNDLMIRGRDFYAVWDEEQRIWSTNEQTVVDIIDREIDRVYQEKKEDPRYSVGWVIKPKRMRYSTSGVIDQWHKYVQKQCRDNYHQLDEKVVFANSRSNKRDYSSKRLPYALEEGDHSAWDELISVLYSDSERDKLEWAIGSVVAGDSKKLQKCIYLYGGPKTGKSTVLDIIQAMFDGYYCIFDAKELGNSNSSFALESFKDNPLVGIQQDGDLSRIDDNTRLNSIISHDTMEVNEKFKSKYTTKFNTFLFMASNKMVKITDGKSGLMRRVIDVSPTGRTVPYEKYNELKNRIINEELGAIAKYCLDRYNALGMNYYSKYEPTKMLAGTNDFYNFIQDMYFTEQIDDHTTLQKVWTDYKMWCDDTDVRKRMNRNEVKLELMNYFDGYEENSYDGKKHERSVFTGFHRDKFISDVIKEGLVAVPNKSWLELVEASEIAADQLIFEKEFADCPAQYGVGEGNERPSMRWTSVKTKLKDLDTTKVHYVRIPETYICIDFDLKDKDGNKSLKLNLEAAESWPKTYAEISKGGQGLHLIYKYNGDTSKLSGIFDEDIEIKVCNGFASMRRRLSKCNDISIATISSGLPLKGGKKVVNLEAIKNEKVLRKIILNCLEKKHHGATAPEVDFIFAELDKAYSSGMKYDISDLYPSVLAFANNSSHQKQKCLRLVDKMHFKSDDISEPMKYETKDGEEPPLVFFDVEIFPNLSVLCYKFENEPSVGLINPEAKDIQALLKYRLIGFNNRKYDNHILYAILHGYSNRQLYNLSQKMINDKTGFFGEAYNLSYTDIYDFASAGNKMSLKKWEIKLGIHHQELGLPWDKPVSEDLWEKVVEYCKNDVEATEAVFNCDELHADFIAREILADIAGMTPNDTTNQLTTRIIFGNEKKPQKDFVYTDLSELFPGYEFNPYGIDPKRYTEESTTDKGTKVTYDDGTTKLMKIATGKSIYRGCDPSEGGRVFAKPGIYFNVALLDVASLHPSSIDALNLFGPYTKNFNDIKLARLLIKHKEFDKAKELFGGKLAKYLDDPGQAKALSNALKTAINSVYGLTSASFENPFRDPRNVDNIVAKRGALFMIELQKTVEEMGYVVAHVKTDSIKIPEADQKIIDFVMDFGKKYGYTFEHEATYERMCIVNESTYIAKDKSDGRWTATAAQFQEPYVFKTLFSHEPVTFEDLCQTKSVTSALYLDFNEALPEGEHNYTFVGKVGSFCPMIPGAGGGDLLREKDGKYNNATGAKGFKWMESEMVRNLGLEDKIDMSYYKQMADEAIDTIKQFGDYELFVSDEPISELPF